MRTLVTRFHLLLVAITLAITAVGFLRIPASFQFPAHWTGSSADWLWPRATLVVSPLVQIVLLLAFHLIGLRLTRNHFSKTQHIFDPALSLLLAVIAACQLGLLLTGIGSDLDLIRITAFGLGALLLVLGIVLFEAERHTYAGLRLPWPIATDSAWRLVHRFAGGAAFLAGATLLLLAWQDVGIGLLTAAFAMAFAVPVLIAGLATVLTLPRAQ